MYNAASRVTWMRARGTTWLATASLVWALFLGISFSWGQWETPADPHPAHVHIAPAADAPSGGFFTDLFKAYTPRRICMFYEAPVIWLHVIADTLIAIAYYSIPFAMGYFAWRRRDLAFRWILWLFVAFILSCGTTHLFGVLDIWVPLYKVDGLIKLATAILSLGTAIALWPLLPHALALPSPSRLAAQVQERTAQLAHTNQALRSALDTAENARAAAERANKAKDHFLAVLSHELRTPLTPVVATIAMLQRSPNIDGDTREQLDIVARNTELEARLIDDLLDATRLTHGKVELDKRPVDLRAILRRTAEVCMADIEARSLRFGLDAGDEPLFIEADPGRLQQVFWNLLKNAVKFTPLGGCVGVRCYRSTGGKAVVEVTDSGEGIDPALLPRLFKPFEQGGRETIRQFGGLGLGLTISKTLVELHGGIIEAASAGKGTGATFTVTLPLCDPSAIPAIPAPSGAVLASATPRHLAILLVEDHGDTSRIMKRLLCGAGYQVETAGDVASGIKAATGRNFDLLLCDLGLPDGNGWDMLRTLRDRGVTTPALALSGFGQEDDVRRSREAGFAAHLTKPTSPDRLFQAIATFAAPRCETDSPG